MHGRAGGCTSGLVHGRACGRAGRGTNRRARARARAQAGTHLRARARAHAHAGSRSKAAIIIVKLIQTLEAEYDLDGFGAEGAADLDPLFSATLLMFRRSKECAAALATCKSDKAREHREVYAGGWVGGCFGRAGARAVGRTCTHAHTH